MGTEWFWGEDGKVGFKQIKFKVPEEHPGGNFLGCWRYQKIGAWMEGIEGFYVLAGASPFKGLG